MPDMNNLPEKEPMNSTGPSTEIASQIEALRADSTDDINVPHFTPANRERQLLDDIDRLQRRSDMVRPATDPGSGPLPMLTPAVANYLRASARFIDEQTFFQERKATCQTADEYIGLANRLIHEQSIFQRAQADVLHQFGVI